MGESDLFEYLLRQGDNALVLGHRLSEWCGKAPALEEDIALANIALDLIGQTQMWLGYAAENDPADRSADTLAFHREVWDFRNLLLVEQPNGNFGVTMMRQLFFDAFNVVNLTALTRSADPRIAEIAAKTVKEATYHLERSRETVIALGDGTEQSHEYMRAALTRLWPYTGEMFAVDPVETRLSAAKIITSPDQLRAEWDNVIQSTLNAAKLDIPDTTFAHKGGKTGTRHTEHLGHMLAVMQSLPRAYPDARW
jgi:ring-1,2-phenylacetyl-CoA epoxidase subunit PaaC